MRISKLHFLRLKNELILKIISHKYQTRSIHLYYSMHLISTSIFVSRLYIILFLYRIIKKFNTPKQQNVQQLINKNWHWNEIHRKNILKTHNNSCVNINKNDNVNDICQYDWVWIIMINSNPLKKNKKFE